MKEWKEEGLAGHEKHLQRVQEEKEKKEMEDRRIFNEQVKYVNDKLLDRERREMRERRHREQAEVDRVEKRAEDRAARRRAKIAGYEAAEREIMAVEDLRSWWYRYDENELIIRTRERENMWNEEMEQTEIDAFWGFFTAAKLKQEALERAQKAYDETVEKYRVNCIHARVIKPYDWEIKEKVHKDVFTGEVIGKFNKNIR